MSSKYCNGDTCADPAKAVDGTYESTGEGLSSIAHSIEEENPWIQIDLGYATCISAVEIWNRNHPNYPGILIINLFDKIIRLICVINHKVVK